MLQISEKFAAPNAKQECGAVGGVGYVLSTFVSYVFSNAELVAGLLTVPATIGELRIVGYLIVFGVREHARPDSESARVAAP